MNYPDFREVSWKVDEPTYRADSALSYSILAQYERTGFNGLSTLFDKKSSPSLTLGSVVDTLITGEDGEFNQKFAVIDCRLTDSGVALVEELLKLSYKHFEDIPVEVVSGIAKQQGFWASDKWDKRRYSEVLNTGNIREFFNASKQSEGKEIITTTVYGAALNMVRALKESRATARYFADNDPLSPIVRYYQLKFKCCLNNVIYRSMADLIIVDHEHKIVYPIDLKTSSHKEWDFEESFIKWSYCTQARLYYANIRANMDKHPMFKSYKLADYRFIVVNQYSLTPLVWEFPYTAYAGTLVDEEGNKYRDPFTIGEELQKYLENAPQVPFDINLEGTNIIKCLTKLN